MKKREEILGDCKEEAYIEGDNLTIGISEDQEYSVEYDEIEEEIVIKQREITFYLS